jgi:hypothetical protein
MAKTMKTPRKVLSPTVMKIAKRQSVLSILQGIDRNSAVRADNTKKRVEEEMAEDKMPQKKKRG